MSYALQQQRWLTAGLDSWRLAWQVGETMAASHAVIATRMAMFSTGLHQPSRMPHAELARLVPEKLEAFREAGSGASRSLALGELALVDGLVALDLVERILAVSLAWWQPFHRRSTANARRLARRRR